MATQLNSSPPPSARPTGTVTFLFSDIEGSTVRWEHDRLAMATALARHDALMRTALEAHRAYVFKTMGDAFCAAFATPADALAAALDAQRALGTEDFSAVEGLRVRMALHAGNTDERDGDYFGPTVNRVARLLAVGNGGQVLLSGACTELIGNGLPVGCSLRDLGEHRLKDLAQPERIHQLLAPDLVADFPPLRSLEHLSNNLPAQVSSFIGREAEIAEVTALIGQHRLVTLVGSGGVGKTRLSLHVAADLVDQVRDGVWFVELAPLSQGEYIPTTVASALGIRLPSEGDLVENLARALKGKELLLVFDNCEHLVEPAAHVISTILRAAPKVKVLASSRQGLGAAGEATYQVPTLDASTAVALFVERARAASVTFALTDDTAPIVAEICRRLDGIPLAIELAAARVKVLSIPSLAQRLNQRFKLLTGGSRDVLPRQKTLGALIDWSYDLLAPQEQVLFTRVGIFAGGFSLDAATAVCSGEDLDEIDILDLLASLTDKSLVVADTTGEHERYHLLESTRAYALEKLTAAGAHEQFARRHAQYFRDQTQAAEERLRSTGLTAPWLANLEVELDNYRAVLEWALKDGRDLVLGGAMAGALSGLWSSRGLAVEGRYWIGLAQAGLDESAHPLVGARLWRVVGSLSSGKHMHDCAQRALALSQSVGDEMGQALALRVLVFSLYQMGRLEEAGDLSARALAAMRTLGNKAEAAACLNHEAAIHLARGHVAAARESWAQALAARKALGDENGAAVVLVNLAELAFDEGQVEQALRLAGEALEIHLREKNASLLAPSYANIAAYRVAAGDLDGAREAAREGLRLARQVQRAPTIAIALQHLALLLALRGEASVAARLICYVNAQYKELGIEREAPEKWGYEKLMAALHEQLSDTQIEKLAAEGAAWSEDQAVEEALKV
jgi:predicted ATPase/class 3 adenylate cyclase